MPNFYYYKGFVIKETKWSKEQKHPYYHKDKGGETEFEVNVTASWGKNLKSLLQAKQRITKFLNKQNLLER